MKPGPAYSKPSRGTKRTAHAAAVSLGGVAGQSSVTSPGAAGKIRSWDFTIDEKGKVPKLLTALESQSLDTEPRHGIPKCTPLSSLRMKGRAEETAQTETGRSFIRQS
jgi:hypothetical protein